MKKLLFITFLLISSVCFGQKNVRTINKNISINIPKAQGLSYIGNGVYLIKRTTIGLKGKRGLERDIRKQINKICIDQKLSHKILNVDAYSNKSWDPVVEITFKLMTKDGELLITKDDAKKQIFELKEFLDLGIITKEEFDDKVKPLKKILFGN